MEDIRTGLSYDDVLLVPKRSPVDDLKQVDTSSTLARDITLDVPVLSAPMDTVTEGEMARAMGEHGGMGVIHRFLTIDEQADAVAHAAEAGAQVAAAIGINEDYLDRARRVLDAGCDVLVMDIAHGHLDACLDAVAALREDFTDVPLVAGNVATAEAVQDFADAGADCVKVGIGPGSHCTTRRVAGAGVPQLTAVHDCAQAADRCGVQIIADGGIRNPGEAVKALMAGADAVMCGGMFAGTDEAPGEIIQRDGDRYKRSRGMASNEARDARTDKDAEDTNAPEGVSALTPYKGPVASVMADLAGGLRSGISYCGADNLDEAREHAEFVRVTDGAKGRAGPHGDVVLDG